jgi:ribosomal protein S18 acetylase RimI-like enzyme
VSIVLLQKLHNRKQFKCEEESLTEYLQKQVNQDIRKRLATCFVLADSKNNVIGYYTLTTESLGKETIPDKYKKGIPRNYNAPVILLGRLARHLDYKGKRIGEYLLIDALSRSLKLSNKSIGAMAVVTDPINKRARDFYKKYGFLELPSSKKLFLPINVIAKIVD